MILIQGFITEKSIFRSLVTLGAFSKPLVCRQQLLSKILKPSINDSLVVIKICQIAAKSVRLRYAGAKDHLEEVLHVGSSSCDLLSTLWTEQWI